MMNDNIQVPPGWITEFIPLGDEIVLCRGWHEATKQSWFVAGYVHKMIDGRWVMHHDGSEPEFVSAWTPIPGYPYSQSFMNRLRLRGYPIYPYLVESADGMAIEAGGIGYSVVYTDDSRMQCMHAGSDAESMAARQKMHDAAMKSYNPRQWPAWVTEKQKRKEEVAAMKKDGRQEAK